MPRLKLTRRTTAVILVLLTVLASGTAMGQVTAYTLDVGSHGATGVGITSSNGDGGTTDYFKTDILYGEGANMTAPLTSGGKNFNDGWGSDLTSDSLGSIRSVTMTSDKTVTVSDSPATVTVAGNLQSEIGCPGDWQPDCSATHLLFDAGDEVWQGTFLIPAGNWEYKAALNDSWDENYGKNAIRDGANIGLSLGDSTEVKFYYSHETHWVADNKSTVIATLPGNFQSSLGCSGDWDPSCLRSWLQDPDGDGLYTFSTKMLPAGDYEVRETHNESWDENYGAGGVPGGANIQFTVPESFTEILFTYDWVTHLLDISIEPTSNVIFTDGFEEDL